MRWKLELLPGGFDEWIDLTPRLVSTPKINYRYEGNKWAYGVSVVSTGFITFDNTDGFLSPPSDYRSVFARGEVSESVIRLNYPSPTGAPVIAFEGLVTLKESYDYRKAGTSTLVVRSYESVLKDIPASKLELTTAASREAVIGTLFSLADIRKWVSKYAFNFQDNYTKIRFDGPLGIFNPRSVIAPGEASGETISIWSIQNANYQQGQFGRWRAPESSWVYIDDSVHNPLRLSVPAGARTDYHGDLIFYSYSSNREYRAPYDPELGTQAVNLSSAITYGSDLIRSDDDKLDAVLNRILQIENAAFSYNTRNKNFAIYTKGQIPDHAVIYLRDVIDIVEVSSGVEKVVNEIRFRKPPEGANPSEDETIINERSVSRYGLRAAHLDASFLDPVDYEVRVKPGLSDSLGRAAEMVQVVIPALQKYPDGSPVRDDVWNLGERVYLDPVLDISRSTARYSDPRPEEPKTVTRSIFDDRVDVDGDSVIAKLKSRPSSLRNILNRRGVDLIKLWDNGLIPGGGEDGSDIKLGRITVTNNPLRRIRVGFVSSDTDTSVIDPLQRGTNVKNEYEANWRIHFRYKNMEAKFSLNDDSSRDSSIPPSASNPYDIPQSGITDAMTDLFNAYTDTPGDVFYVAIINPRSEKIDAGGRRVIAEIPLGAPLPVNYSEARI